MRNLILVLTAVVALAGSASAEDHTAILNGTQFKIDDDGNVWRQKGGLWVEVRRGGIFKNTQRISASQSDNVLIVLQDSVLHAVEPDSGKYTVLTRGLRYEPKKVTGLCGLNKHAFFVYDDQLVKVRLDGTGGLEPVNAQKPWDKVEGMASNVKSMIFVRDGRMYRLFEDGTFIELFAGSGAGWKGTTSIFPASEGNYVVEQNGWLHLVSDVDGKGIYKLVQK